MSLAPISTDEFETYAQQGILAEHLADAGVVIDGLCFECGETVPADACRLVEPTTTGPASVSDAMPTPTTILSEARQRARNGLRAHLAAYGRSLPVLPVETDPLTGAALRTAGKRIQDRLDHEPIVPTIAHRIQKANPAPWMRRPTDKPVRRHARH